MSKCKKGIQKSHVERLRLTFTVCIEVIVLYSRQLISLIEVVDQETLSEEAMVR